MFGECCGRRSSRPFLGGADLDIARSCHAKAFPDGSPNPQPNQERRGRIGKVSIVVGFLPEIPNPIPLVAVDGAVRRTAKARAQRDSASDRERKVNTAHEKSRHPKAPALVSGFQNP